jgi:hypothetical protein
VGKETDIAQYAVIFLLRNGEDKFLNNWEISVFFTCIVVKASTVFMEDGRKDVL